MKRVAGYFVQGLLFIAPIGVTVYVVYLVFKFIDNLLKTYIDPVLPINIPGVNLLVVLIVIALLGFLGKSIIASPVRAFFAKLLKKAPLIKIIYTSIRDLLSAFVGKERKFNKPVLVRVNTISNLEKLGFLTQEDLSSLGIKEKKVAVYFPHSYNFSGEMFIVPVEHVTPVKVPSAEVMKIIISGGVAGF
ncbi:MAG: DUF502 domain-containing protein [Bacteroidales bacterium]|nr:DUF502 domain-containing protein [Bacteroidales bacterium]